MAIVIDDLIARLLFQTDRASVAAMEAQVAAMRRRLDRFAAGTATSGLVITAAAAGTVAAFAQYESGLAKTEGLVGINRDQVNAYGEDIKRLAREVGVSVGSLTDALFFTTSAGIRGAAVVKVLETTARASRAGLGNQAAIVDLVTSAMNAYAKSGLTAIEVTDTLTEAIRLGKLEPTAMAGAMGHLLPVASAMGVQFHEVAGLMAAMSRTGADVHKISTQLRQVLNTILNPAAEAEKAMAGVGLSAQLLRDAAGQGPNGLFSVLQLLKAAFDGNNQALVQIFPNIRAIVGVFDILGDSLDVNRDLMDQMRESVGTLDEAYAAVENTVETKFRRAMAGAQVMAIEMGETLRPVTIRVLELAAAKFDDFLDLPPETKENIGKLLLIGPGLLAAAGAAKLLSFALLPVQATLRTINVLAGAAEFYGLTSSAGGARVAVGGVAKAIWRGPFIAMLALGSLSKKTFLRMRYEAATLPLTYAASTTRLTLLHHRMLGAMQSRNPCVPGRHADQLPRHRRWCSANVGSHIGPSGSAAGRRRADTPRLETGEYIHPWLYYRRSWRVGSTDGGA